MHKCLQRASLALPSLAAHYHSIREPQPSTGHRCLCALGTTCLLLLVSSLLAFRLGRSLGGPPLEFLEYITTLTTTTQNS